MPDDDALEAFLAEARRSGEVVGLADADGFCTAPTPSGVRAMPFWSRRSRAERVRSTVPAYRPLTVVALSLEQWREGWLPGLARDGLRVGLNWTGSAAGADLPPTEVLARL